MKETGESSSSDNVAINDTDAAAAADAPGTSKDTVAGSAVTDGEEAISKEDLIELIRAVKFKNTDFSQRQVYNEIVTEIPVRFPQYAASLHPDRLCLNDVKKAWKKAILQQQQPSSLNSGANANTNADLAERLRKMTTNPQLYTIGLENSNNEQNNNAAAARAYVTSFLEETHAKNSSRERELLEDYVHVFLNVPADSSIAKKPHQALINFQAPPGSNVAKPASKKGNKKKKGGKKKVPAAATPQPSAVTLENAPFDDALVVKIQMAAPLDASDSMKHPMLLYDKTRAYKTFVHPEGALTGTSNTAVENAKNKHSENDDGYSRLARWIRTKGIGGALGSAGGTKAYFYARLATTAKAKQHNQILSIYVKTLAPSEGQDF
ncbi:unnamed protein product [Pseudo-nitzschia multistriata]|uniref:Uncharacterized protein n=1 Tax=Pseudo-nitzschia multistriata TaxID=183589 RepID=A0A448ZDW8_9STRA|nr:unnamed protein product [Pseudo-nitzschia multistriata]